jgi:hypothetical protein
VKSQAAARVVPFVRQITFPGQMTKAFLPVIGVFHFE